MAWTKEQQLAIKEYGKNIIVSAGAGSGKTAVLSERVLEHVKNGIDINELLILTFTNAAAGEMKERIRNKLIKSGYNEQAQKLDISYITTFDSFALSILKKYSYTLNLSKNINIIDNSLIILKKQEILESIFNKYYEENNELFLKLINDFSLKDDKEVFDSILYLDNSLNNLIDKEEYLKSYLNNYYDDINVNNLIDKYIIFLKNKIKQINIQVDNISNYVESNYLNKLNDSLNNLFKSNSYEEIKYNVNNLELPRLSNSCDEAKLIKEEITNLKKELIDLTWYSSLEEIINSIYLTKDYVEIIIKIILELNEKVLDYKKSILSFEFIDIAKMAINILQDNEDIRLSLKNTFKEILIDEYQDTNDLQDLFISLIENNNQYVVGDIKQSIYRFRNANPKLFKIKYDEYSKNDNDLKIDLNKNFRSRNEVINNINLIFNLIMDDDLGGADYIKDHQMIFGQDNYSNKDNLNYNMEILNYNIDKDDKRYSKTEIEIFTIAKDIKNKINNNFKVMDKDTFEIRNVRYEDFCILIDRSKHFNLYKKIFEYLNIPITIMKDSKITNSLDIDIIKNIYNLIICIKNKDYKTNFKYSFMSLGRSYLFEYKDNDILEIFESHNYFNNDLFKITQSIVNDIDNLTNKQIYELIIEKYNIYEKLIKIGNVKEHIITLDYIKNIIDNLDKIGYTYIDFYNYLENIIDKDLDINLSLNKESNNSVKIMTIHTSKGLEYPICYFSALDEKFNISDIKDKFIYSNDYGLITPYLDNNNLKNTIIKTLFKESYYKEEISEKLRLLYVALTRAREKIIFVTSLNDNILAYKDNGIIDDNTRINYRSFNDILSSIYKSINKYIINVNIDNIELTKAYNFQKDSDIKINEGNKLLTQELPINNILKENKHFSKESHVLYSKEEKNNINLGLRMHYILETIDFNNPNVDNLSDYEISLLNKFLETKVFEGANEIYKEFEFYKEENNILEHGIIDLLLVFNDYNIIIDYKLKNIQDVAYVKQLDGYKKYIESITNKKTFIYLYSIIDGNLIKIER